MVLEIETTTGWRGDIELVRKVSPLMMSIGAVKVDAPQLDEHHRDQPVETRSWNNVPESRASTQTWKDRQEEEESARSPFPPSGRRSQRGAALSHSISMPGDVGARAIEELGSAGRGRTRGSLGLFQLHLMIECHAWLAIRKY